MRARLQKSRAVGLGAVAALAVVGVAAAQGNGEPAHRSAAELRQAVAKTKDGLATSPIPTGTATVIMVRRERTGEVELHMGQNDVFVAHDGHATVLIGDKVDGNHEVSPGEFRGGKLSGAKSYAMNPGDVVWIPAGLPHQVVVPAHGSFNYLAFKYPSAKKP